MINHQMGAMVVEIGSNGQLTLSQQQLASAGFSEHDQVAVLPQAPGQVILRKVTPVPLLSREELSILMTEAFQEAGYTTREEILALLKETRRELAAEW